MQENTSSEKFMFALTIVVLLVFMVMALLMYTFRNEVRITSENQEYLVDNTRHMAEEVDAAISEGYDNIKILSSLVSQSLTSPEFDITNIQELIQDSVFDFMEFVDKDGVNHNITGGVSAAWDRQYYLDAKAGNIGMELIYVSRTTHETLLIFYAPLYFEKQFIGSLVGTYQTNNRITHLLSREYFGEPALSYLATGKGRIIASSQTFDPQNKMYVTDIAKGNPEIAEKLQTSLQTGETVTFSLEENTTGGCMQKLANNDGYIVQIFPQEANHHMIAAANELGYTLVTFLIALYIVILFALISFYRTQSKRVEAAKMQAEMANRAKTSFLFNMSHDIRTPMNAILGFTDMAKKNLEHKEKLLDCLEKTHQAGNLLLSLINSVLEMSRIESGKAELDEKPVKVEDSFESIKATLLELAKKKNITLHFAIENITDHFVYVDFDRAVRVFINIISNSVKYTNEGGKIQVTCEQIGKENGCGIYQYTFADNGIGMSEEFQKHLFDEFSREKNSTTSGVQGYGLGLSVVKSFVHLLGGVIECKSKQGEGTTFIVTLPLRLQENQEAAQYVDQLTGETVKVQAAVQEETAELNLRGKRILVVEDNEMNREIAAFILEEEEIVVEEADDGTTAVALLQEKGAEYYDAILMDIQMPMMNGYEAARTIRAMYPDAKLPIIAVSANAFAEDKVMSIAAGMNDHIAKPINVAELFAALSKLL